MLRRFFPVLLLVTAFVGSVFGRIEPRFHEQTVAWSATEIVRVAYTPLPGEFEVLDRWKGTLRIGGRVRVPEMVPLQKSSLPVSGWTERGIGQVDELRTSEAILFLKRGHGDDLQHGKAVPELKPASDDGMNVSVAFVGGHEYFAYMQLMNPGDVLLVRFGDLESLQKVVADTVAEQKQFSKAAETRNKQTRAALLVEFLTSKNPVAVNAATEALKRCGSAAIPALSQVLHNPHLVKAHVDAVEVLTGIGGAAVASELASALDEKLRFWRITGARLGPGWWDSGDENGLRDQYVATLDIVKSLTQLHDRNSARSVASLRELWISRPELNDPSGLNALANACDDYLSAASK